MHKTIFQTTFAAAIYIPSFCLGLFHGHFSLKFSRFTCDIRRYLFNSRNKPFIQGVSTLWQSVTALPSFLFLSAQISCHSEHFSRVYRLGKFLRSKRKEITRPLHESDNFQGNYFAFSVTFLPKTRAYKHGRTFFLPGAIFAQSRIQALLQNLDEGSHYMIRIPPTL